MERSALRRDRLVKLIQCISDPLDLRTDGLVIWKGVVQSLQGLNGSVLVLQKIFFDLRLLTQCFPRI